MARSDFTVLCRAATLDPFNNSVSLHQLAESISIHVPMEVPIPTGDEVHTISSFDWVLASMVRRSVTDMPEDLRGRVTIILPNGRSLDGLEFQIDLKTSSTVRNLIQVPVLPFVLSGDYRFQLQALLEAGWTVLSECRVPITVARAPAESE